MTSTQLPLEDQKSFEPGEVIDAEAKQLSVSVSGVMNFMESPAHYYCFNVLKEKRDTEAMEEGKQLHMLVLETDKFYEQYCTVREFPEGTIVLRTVEEMKAFIEHYNPGVKTKGKKAEISMAVKTILRVQNVQNVVIYDDEVSSINKEFITKTRWDQLHRMKASILAHRVARKYLEMGHKELKLEGIIDGVHVRGRLDWLVDDPSLPYIVIMDLKKARSVKFNKFRFHIWDYHYYIQAYLYTKLAELHYGRPCLYVWVAAETGLPYITETYSADEATLDAGESAFKWCAKKLEECYRTGIWHGYTDGMVHNIGLPHYGFDRIAELEQELDEPEYEEGI